MMEYVSDKHLDFSHVVNVLLKIGLENTAKLTPEILNKITSSEESDYE